jgi:hypothetical protein
VENVNEGYVTIRAGRGSFTLTTKADFREEGDETVRIEFYTHQNVAATGPLTVPDTSLTTLYYIASSPSSVASESDALTFTVTTENVADDTVLYWKNIGTSSAADFVENINEGSLTIVNNSASFTLTLRPDATLEGPETLRIGIYTDPSRLVSVVLSSIITIPDTSTVPFYPTSVNNLFAWYDGKDPNNTGILPTSNAYLATWVDRSGSSNNLTWDNSLVHLARWRNDYVDYGTYTKHFFPSSGMAQSNYDFYAVLMPVLGTRTLGMGTNANNHEEEPVYMWGSNIGLTSNRTFYQYGTLTTTSNTMSLFHVRVNSNGNPTASLNASPYASPSSTIVFSAATRSFGGRTDQLSNAGIGRVYEYVRFHSNLATTDRNKIEGYLAWKWGIQSSLPSNHPYKTAAPV